MITYHTISSNLTPATGLAFDFINNETVTIAPGIVVESKDDTAIYSGDTGVTSSVLINHGEVISDNYWGVVFNQINGSITNTTGALIQGWLVGAALAGGNETVDNSGTISGLATGTGVGVFFYQFTTGVKLTNHGHIFGAAAGIENQSSSADGVISNFGLINSAFTAIYLDNLGAGPTTTITNAANATISGSVHAILADAGAFALTNYGKITGDIVDSANLHDSVVNHGTLQNKVDLGGGADTFIGTGGGAAVVFGGTGSDHLVGGSKADKLHGGNGNDLLTGGGGADQFFFDTALNQVSNVDHITDFAPHVDKIMLSHAIFTATNASGALSAGMFSGTFAEHAATRIIYYPANGFLYYDQDGNHITHLRVHFATLATHLTLHNTDFIITA